MTQTAGLTTLAKPAGVGPQLLIPRAAAARRGQTFSPWLLDDVERALPECGFETAPQIHKRLGYSALGTVRKALLRLARDGRALRAQRPRPSGTRNVFARAA